MTEVQKTNDELVDHVVTQDDLDLNPEWVEQGVEVGETIEIPKTDHDDLISINGGDKKEDEVKKEEISTEAVEAEVVKTVVPVWARLEGEDVSEPVENTLVEIVEEVTIIPKDDTPEWAKAEKSKEVVE